MPTPAQNTDPSPHLDLYREALRRLLVANGIVAGTMDAVGMVAEGLRSRPQFRVRLLSFLEGFVRREAEPVSRLELLALLTSAARGVAVDLADPALRAPMGELLDFVSEAEQGYSRISGISGSSGISDISQVLDKGAVRRPRLHLRPGVMRSRPNEGQENEAEDTDATPGSGSGRSSRRRAYVSVALFCIVIGLVAGLLSRGHRRLQTASGMEVVAGGTADAAAPGGDVAPPEGGASSSLASGASSSLASGATSSLASGATSSLASGAARSRKRDVVEVRGSRRFIDTHLRATARGERTSVSRKRGAPPREARPLATPGTAASAKRHPPGVSVTVSTPAASAGSSRGMSLQAAGLRPAAFQPAGRVADREAIASALLRGTDGEASRNLLSAAATFHPNVVTGSAGIMAANVLSSPAPAYPAQASASHVEGEVVIQAVVGRDGRIVGTRLVSGPPQLQAAALEAVGRWSYRPYVINGKPAEIATTAIVDFRLGR